MSMLSAQCDELREMADQLQEHGTFVGFGGTTNTDPLMHGAAIVMREAADTIWELRDMVHKELAENDKLREERREYQATIDSLVNECDDHKTENAKLRKLVKRMHRHIKQTCDVCDEYYCSNFDEDNECCVFDVLARELGVDDV